MLTLYHHGSSACAAKVRFALAEKHLNRLDVLAMDGLWLGGRLPRVTDWFERVRGRPTFKPSLVDLVPSELAREMRVNGEKSWPQIRALLARGESLN